MAIRALKQLAISMTQSQVGWKLRKNAAFPFQRPAIALQSTQLASINAPITGLLCVTLTLTLAACKPPAADDYVQRIELADVRGGPRAPLPDPDVAGAIWAPVEGGVRLLYGRSGETPMLALECTGHDAAPSIELTRYVQADLQSKALMALIGNNHIARLPVDAQWNGKAWLWVGRYPADDPDLAVFAGEDEVELTIPGAGSLMLNASPLPELLIGDCAAPIDPQADLPEALLPTPPE